MLQTYAAWGLGAKTGSRQRKRKRNRSQAMFTRCIARDASVMLLDSDG